MYPIGDLLLKKLKEKNMTIVDAVRLMGYLNINNGIRAFYEMVMDALFDQFILKNIHKALDITPEEIVAALKATNAHLKAEIKTAIEEENAR